TVRHSSRLHTFASTNGSQDGQVRLRIDTTIKGPDSTPAETALARISTEPTATSTRRHQAA
ncbi:hypothetical protein, partial [Streptomyces spinoverrucosus]|uniref:hypothetical protein n=1 Tax=Streptomyces spinoverrucosus TaxID=284043 RepID=UPI001C3FB316